MNAARESILARIRDALTDVPQAETPEDVPVPRTYRHASGEPHDVIVARFVERVSDYRATVTRVERDELAVAIGNALQVQGVERLAIPSDLPAEWLPAGIELLTDADLSNVDLDGCGGVLTGCALGIAETGTIVLDGGVGQGRRALTLIPDYHLCVIYEHQIEDGVPEAIAALASAARRRQPITFISGPSATSDIELSRVEGVHGPRTLEVLVVR